MSMHFFWLRSMFGRPRRTAWWPPLMNHSAKRDRGSKAHSSRQYLVLKYTVLGLPGAGLVHHVLGQHHDLDVGQVAH
eukprot:14929263-Heterocapsa_arctica.AAC.1